MRDRAKRLEELGILQSRLGYRYKEASLLNTALTHSSYANERNLSIEHYNERLEFLGDAVLEMVTSEFLYNRFKGHPEGALTKMRASLVRGDALGLYSSKLGLGDFLLMGKGEENTGGRKRASILADAFEAVIGSIYIDGGYQPARNFVLRYIEDRIDISADPIYARDHKTELQERVQASGGQAIEYRLTAQEGPDHDKTFRIQVCIGGEISGEGMGKSKKEAQQNAAKRALEKLEE